MGENQRKKLALVVQGGTLDKLYCAFILAATAVVMDMEAHLYFTFWGLNMLVKAAMDKAGLPVTYKYLEEKMKYPTPYEMLRSRILSRRSWPTLSDLF